ncbi:hypothetical protein R5R35_005526 [Gryllus longicercus]|uniref:Uncharacterized protein n=1 Tax=Gryllus longicercus TaxID=2509291 RepID=A0AAN9Z8F6_9ORTH
MFQVERHQYKIRVDRIHKDVKDFFRYNEMDNPVDSYGKNLLRYSDVFDIKEDELSGLSDVFDITEDELSGFNDVFENEEEFFEPVDNEAPVTTGPATRPRMQDEDVETKTLLAIEQFHENENQRKELYKYKLFLMKEENRRQEEMHALKMLCIQNYFFQNYSLRSTFNDC